MIPIEMAEGRLCINLARVAFMEKLDFRGIKFHFGDWETKVVVYETEDDRDNGWDDIAWK